MPGTVLVTGGSGFIGTWVVRELLAHGARVVVLDVQPAPERWQAVLGSKAAEVAWTNTAITDRDALQSLINDQSVSRVIHLAALLTPACQQDPFVGCQVNVLGSTAVFDAARRSGRVQAISYASSYAVYGDGSLGANNEPNHPPTFYGAFKQAVDGIAEQYWQHYGLRSLAVRPHVVYGPEREQGLTAGPSLACRAAVCGESYTIGYTGVVGYDYVEDVARAFVRGVLECPPGAGIVDMPSEPATPDQFVRLIEAAVPEAIGRIRVDGPAIPPNIPPMARDLRRVFSDWRSTSLADGVARTIDFYRYRGR